MAQHTLNLSKWLERLGFKGGREPRFIEAIQPVHVVGDASSLVPPILPPLAWSGGFIDNTVGGYGCLQFQSLAPGGSFIREIRVGFGVAAATQDLLFFPSGTTGVIVTGSNVAKTNRNLVTDQPTVSEVRLIQGIVTPAGVTDGPLAFVAPAEPFVLVDPAYIGPGEIYQVGIPIFGAGTIRTRYAILFEDVMTTHREA